MSIFPNSLSSRLLAITAIWTVLALLVVGLILSALFRQNVEQNFNDLLQAHTFNLMGAIEVSDANLLEGEPNLGDPRFLTPLSGWYWVVSKAENPGKAILHSPSISGEDLAVPPVSEQPFNTQFRRTYRVSNADGQPVQRLEAQLFVGESDTLYQVMVAAGRLGLEQTIADFNRNLLLFFSLFGLGTIAATYFVIRFGLRPLDQAAKALSDVREGRAESINGEYPTEVAPLVGEINGLIEVNRSVVERARTQVGNLAHALKTPLAVISNETGDLAGTASKTIAEQAGAMQAQIQAYLNRARIAAQVGTVTARSPVAPVIERLLRVMRKLSPEKEFEISIEDEPVFAGEEQDLEEILGNLLENASLHAKSNVNLSVTSSSRKSGKHPMLELRVEDDGPGVSAEKRNKILERGRRLDETVPGSGLGLSIVKDIVDEYAGELEMTDSPTGGLCVVVLLPRKAATRTPR